MNIPKQNKKAAAKNEDWAIIPFDEAEDDRRWKQLISDTDELIAEAEQLESVYGVSLRENKISNLKTSETPPEDELF